MQPLPGCRSSCSRSPTRPCFCRWCSSPWRASRWGRRAWRPTYGRCSSPCRRRFSSFSPGADRGWHSNPPSDAPASRLHRHCANHEKGLKRGQVFVTHAVPRRLNHYISIAESTIARTNFETMEQQDTPDHPTIVDDRVQYRVINGRQTAAGQILFGGRSGLFDDTIITRFSSSRDGSL